MVDCNGDSFVEESEEAFDKDGLVVAAAGSLAGNFECFAHGSEVLEERGACIGGNLKAEANAEEDVFHEGSGKGGGVNKVNVNDDGECGEVAHGGKDVLGSAIAGDVAWLPDVDMDNGEWGGDWPGVDKFAATAEGGVGKDAVRASFEPGFDIGAEFVPEEAEADTVEGFVLAKMAAGGGRVECGEEVVTKRGWRNDK